MTEVNVAIANEVKDALSNDRLDIPVLPEVASTIREAMYDKNMNAKKMATVIGQDPGISSQMVKIANSPAFRGVQDIESLEMAISRIGLTNSGNMAQGLAMDLMFKSKNKRLDRILRHTWRQAKEVAGLAGMNAKHFTKLQPGTATLGGLTYNIGVLPILAFAEKNPQWFEQDSVLIGLMESTQSTLGTQILETWGFPDEIVKVPALYRDFSREVTAVDYVDVVQVSYLQSIAGTAHSDAQLDCAEIPAFGRLGLDPNQEDEDLDAEMAAAMSSLVR